MSMAHQCLQCGTTFPDGSPQLLRGCSCGGTRFFYTQSPLAKREREALMREANKDIRAILEELVKGGGSGTTPRPEYENPLWSREAREQWVRVDAAKLRAHEEGAVQQVASPEAPPPKAPAPKPHATSTLPLAQERPQPTSTTPALDDSEPREARPEVIVVKEPGKYELDVEQLLENSPIVVRRDGVYVVHLPSVFATQGKRA